EDRALLAERARERVLELLHHAAERVRIGRDAALVEDAREDGRVLRRRQPETVAAQTDKAIVGGCGSAIGRSAKASRSFEHGASRSFEHGASRSFGPRATSSRERADRSDLQEVTAI